MHRRRVLAGAGAAGLASLAGCFGLLGDDMTTFEASPGGVTADASTSTGYEEVGVDAHVVTQTFSAAGQSEDVEVTNYATRYEKGVDMGPLGRQKGAVCFVITSPQVKVLGKGFNPLRKMSTEDVVGMVGKNYGGLRDVQTEDERSVQVLDQETTEAIYTGDADFNGQSVSVRLHVTEAVETSSDLLITISVYPDHLRSQESEHVRELLGSVTEEPQADDWESAYGDGGGGSNDSADGGSNDSDGATNENDDDGFL